VSATSGCGKVNVTMNGTGHVSKVSISGDLSGHDLEVAIEEATNAAAAAAKQLYAESITQLVSDMNLNLPGMDRILSSFTGTA
jgi:DNA-binding protein YbaB